MKVSSPLTDEWNTYKVVIRKKHWSHFLTRQMIHQIWMTPTIFDRGRLVVHAHHKTDLTAGHFDRHLEWQLYRRGTGFETHGRPMSWSGRLGPGESTNSLCLADTFLETSGKWGTPVWKVGELFFLGCIWRSQLGEIFKPLVNPKRDLHLNSPHITTPESNMKVVEIKAIINN